MKGVNYIEGRQGQWWAKVQYDDGIIERVPCVHGLYWSVGNHYHDSWERRPELMRTKKFAEHAEMLRTLKRCVVTDSTWYQITRSVVS